MALLLSLSRLFSARVLSASVLLLLVPALAGCNGSWPSLYEGETWAALEQTQREVMAQDDISEETAEAVPVSEDEDIAEDLVPPVMPEGEDGVDEVSAPSAPAVPAVSSIPVVISNADKLALLRGEADREATLAQGLRKRLDDSAEALAATLTALQKTPTLLNSQKWNAAQAELSRQESYMDELSKTVARLTAQSQQARVLTREAKRKKEVLSERQAQIPAYIAGLAGRFGGVLSAAQAQLTGFKETMAALDAQSKGDN